MSGRQRIVEVQVRYEDGSIRAYQGSGHAQVDDTIVKDSPVVAKCTPVRT